MANFGKFKTLGTPPPPTEASPNLSAPETAPSEGGADIKGLPATEDLQNGIQGSPSEEGRRVEGGAGEAADVGSESREHETRKATQDAQPATQNIDVTDTASSGYQRKIDGRSARRTNRTVQFATRVTPEFDERIRQIAQRDNLLLVEVMERALDSYEKNGS